MPVGYNPGMELIYLDHNATTPTHPEVVEAMARCYAQGLANPASQHRPGQQARRVLEDAREKIAEILGADLAPPRRDRLIFTSGGTEANNLAVLGIARPAAHFARCEGWALQCPVLSPAASSSRPASIRASSSRPNTSWSRAGGWTPWA